MSLLSPNVQSSTYDSRSSNYILPSEGTTYSVASDQLSYDSKREELLHLPAARYSGSGIISPAPPSRLSETSCLSTQRAKQLVLTIDNTFNSGSFAHICAFDLERLEKQALLYLKLEDEHSAKYNKPLLPSAYFKRIIAACCYLQHFQALKKILISEV